MTFAADFIDDTFPLPDLTVLKITSTIPLKVTKEEIKAEVRSLTTSFFKELCEQRPSLEYDKDFVDKIANDYNAEVDRASASELLALHNAVRFRSHLIRVSFSFIVKSQNERIEYLEKKLAVSDKKKQSSFFKILKVRAPESVYDLLAILGLALAIFLFLRI